MRKHSILYSVMLPTSGANIILKGRQLGYTKARQLFNELYPAEEPKVAKPEPHWVTRNNKKRKW